VVNVVLYRRGTDAELLRFGPGQVPGSTILHRPTLRERDALRFGCGLTDYSNRNGTGQSRFCTSCSPMCICGGSVDLAADWGAFGRRAAASNRQPSALNGRVPGSGVAGRSKAASERAPCIAP
jgi:hypothetical protein